MLIGHFKKELTPQLGHSDTDYNLQQNPLTSEAVVSVVGGHVAWCQGLLFLLPEVHPLASECGAKIEAYFLIFSSINCCLALSVSSMFLNLTLSEAVLEE